MARGSVRVARGSGKQEPSSRTPPTCRFVVDHSVPDSELAREVQVAPQIQAEQPGGSVTKRQNRTDKGLRRRAQPDRFGAEPSGRPQATCPSASDPTGPAVTDRVPLSLGPTVTGEIANAKPQAGPTAEPEMEPAEPSQRGPAHELASRELAEQGLGSGRTRSGSGLSGGTVSSRMATPGRVVRVPFSARLVEVGPSKCLVDMRDNKPARSFSRDELLVLLEGAPIPESAPKRLSLWFPGHVVSETENKIEVMFEDKSSFVVRSSIVKEAAPPIEASRRRRPEALTGPGISSERPRQAKASQPLSPTASEEGLPVKTGHVHQNRRPPKKRTRLERQESGSEESARRVQQKSTRKATPAPAAREFTDATTAQMVATPAAAATEMALEAARLCAEANRQAAKEKTQLAADRAQLEAAADEAASAAEAEKAELEAEKAQLQAALDKATSAAEAERARHEAEKARLEAALDEASSTAAAEKDKGKKFAATAKTRREADNGNLEAALAEANRTANENLEAALAEANRTANGNLEAALAEANRTAAAEKVQLEADKAQLEAEKAEGSRSAAAEKAKFKASLDKHERSAAAEKSRLEAVNAQLEAVVAECNSVAAAEKAQLESEKAQLEAAVADFHRSSAAALAEFVAKSAAAEQAQLEAAVAEANKVAEAEQAKLAAQLCASIDRLEAEKGQLEMEKTELESALNVAQTGWDAANNERDRTQAALRELHLKVQDLTQAHVTASGIMYGGLDQALNLIKTTSDLNQINRVAPGLSAVMQAPQAPYQGPAAGSYGTPPTDAAE